MSDLAASYGDTTAEYLAAHRAGLVTGWSRLLWAEGPDTVSFLQGILTQDVAAMGPGSIARSLLLEPRGKLVATMWLIRGENRIGAFLDAAVAAQALEALTRWRFRVDVELRLDERPVIEVWGSEAVPTAAAVLDPAGGWAHESGRLAAAASLGPLGRCFTAGIDADELVAAGAVPIGRIAADTVRIETGEPLMGRDLDDATIPQESGLVPASVSFTKGCYLGQELVARIDTRGHVNRRLAGVRMLEPTLPPVGATVAGAERDYGTITTVGESLDLRAPVAMGLLRREAEAGTRVEVRWDGGAAAATVMDLPAIEGPGGA